MNRLKHLFTGRHYHRLRVPVQISAPFEGISASRGDPSLRHRLPLLPPPISASLRVKEYNAWRKTTHQRKTLPPELSRDVVTLTCKSSANGGVCDVYVVTKSCRDVQAVIDLVKPQVVFVEFCSNRVHVIMEITRRRLWAKSAKMPLWHMIRWPLWEMYHSVKDGLLRLPKPLAKQVKEWDDCDVSANSHEVEKYISASLLEVARKHNSVVAVMQKNWKQPIDIERLIEMSLLKQRLSFIIFNTIIITIWVILLLQCVTRDEDNGVED